jgi:tetrahydromethanopterin S-methyltransferase subunit F
MADIGAAVLFAGGLLTTAAGLAAGLLLAVLAVDSADR